MYLRGPTGSLTTMVEMFPNPAPVLPDTYTHHKGNKTSNH